VKNNISIENLNKFISLVARRVDKTTWHRLPKRTSDIFYTHKNINKWIVKADDSAKMFFLEDLGFTVARVVFPNNNFSISDIPELSDFTIDIKNRIASVEKQLEKEYFCLVTRDFSVPFHNMSQNSISRYFGLKHDFKALAEANENIETGNFKSAVEYANNVETRENILKFILGVLMQFNSKIEPLLLQEITILCHLREYNEVGAKFQTIITLFKGAIGQRQTQIYLAKLHKEGYILRSGTKANTIYSLSSKGMLYINDYADRIIQL
jgi:predicted transcriptional regulator